MHSAFYAFSIKKSLLGQASVGRRSLAGQLLEDAAETGCISKTDGDGDFGYAPGAAAEKIPGLLNSAAVKILLIGQAHHFLEYSRKVGRGHAGLPGNGVEADISPVVIVDITNGLLDLMILDEGDGGRRHSWLDRRLGRRKNVCSAGLLQVIASAVTNCLDDRLLVAMCFDDENENGWLNVLDFLHDETSSISFMTSTPACRAVPLGRDRVLLPAYRDREGPQWGNASRDRLLLSRLFMTCSRLFMLFLAEITSGAGF
jgi:hypothetical protein